jgi:carnitine 3-dehydrogenase
MMSLNQPVRRIAIVGTGVIGASWAAYYLARGFDVVATDPGPQSEANLRKYVDEAWPLLTQVGLSSGASRERLTFTLDMSRALAEADWVQENAPERPDFKIKLFAQMDEATPPNSILASSSSGITMDVIQSGCKRPERCVIGHPFNPPHVVPLVEVVGGAKTSEATIERAMAFYAAIGKKPVRLHKALPGHVANRFQAGSYRVVVSLTRTVLWLLSMGLFDKAYARETADSTDEHKYVAPDLFTAETPLGTYQGMTDQVVLSRTPGAFRTVLVPRASSKPEWLP